MTTNTNEKLLKTKESKEQIIERLLAKAELDFKCCGHGHLKGSKN